MIMLGGFLVYWNANQYRVEKIELEKDLNDQMQLANSALNDSIFHAIFYVATGDSIPRDDSIMSITINSNADVVERDTNIFISIATNQTSIKVVDSMIVGQMATLNSANASSSISLDGRENVKASASTSFEKIIHHDGIIEDIKSYFQKNLEQQNLPLDFEEITLSNPNSLKGAIVVPYEGMMISNRDENKYAVFKNYTSYLIKKILPSALMSTFLFSFVGLAFLQMRKNLNRQKQLAEMKSEFISNMTHELKTPIATMGVALEALSDFGGMNDPKRKAEYLDISKHELNRLEILVDKVMQMSSIENNELKIEMEPLDLKSLSDKMIKSMRLQFENAQVQLSQDIEGSNFNVKGDKMHLTNVLYNLLDNALKYSKQNPTIQFSLKEKEKHIAFEIEDNGIGIKPEYQKKVFDRFFRVPTNDIHNVKGHGIGLNYVADIIEKHQGDIKLISEENKGTRITVTLPKI